MLEVLVGDITIDKVDWCVSDMQTLLDEKKVQEVFYLVPDHIKFDAEIDLLSRLNQGKGISGSLAVQVYSFSRLAWYLLKDTGVLSKTMLSQVGLGMLLRHILETKKDSLIIYRGEIDKPGFIKQLVELFLELRSGQVTEEDFSLFIEKLENDTTYSNKANNKSYLKEKISELKQLYTAFNEVLIGQYIEKEDLYTQLTQQIMQNDLSQTAVYIYGFERFTASEQQIVNALLHQAYKVVITLPVSKQGLLTKADNPLEYVGVQTYQKLLAMNVSKQQYRLIEANKVYPYSPDRLQVIQLFENVYKNGRDLQKNGMSVTGTTLTTYVSKQEEVSQVSNEIARLISTGQYRYKDILVLMRQVEDYELIINPLFKENDIPYFMDNAESMAYHPLTELLASLYAVQKRNWQYVDIMRCLKCGLLSVGDQKEIDLLENELLSQGYQFLSWWVHPKEWVQETIRQKIVDTLLPFFDKLQACHTMKQAAETLYTFLVEANVVKKLIETRDELLALGDLQRAKQYEQVWQTYVDLLDEFVVILGEKTFDIDTFYRLLLGGFEEAEYSLVPPSLDQVTVSSLDGKRIAPKKIVFVLGLNASVFPMTYDNQTLLSNEEREQFYPLLQEGHFLSLLSTYRTMIEPFVAYQVFASATQLLHLSDVLNEEKQSAYLQLVQQAFNLKSLHSPFGKAIPTMKRLIVEVKDAYDNKEELSEVSRHLIHYLTKNTRTQKRMQYLLSSLTHKNTPHHLINAKELYKGQLTLSVSQIETYFKDPYSHFLVYGLGLKERRTFQLTPADVGTVWHDILDKLYKTINYQSLRTLSLEDVLSLSRQTAQDVFTAYPQFHRTKTMQFSQHLLQDTLLYTMKQLYAHAVNVPIQTIQSEVGFSSKGSSPLFFPYIALENNEKLAIRGKIDRIDKLADQFLGVVDYKSSNQLFNMQRFYEGLSLQLVTYLYVAGLNAATLLHGKKRNEQIKQDSAISLIDEKTMENLLGAFYYHIAYPYEEGNSDRVKEKRLLNGLFTKDAAVMKKLDEDANAFKVAFVKSGDFSKVTKDKVLSLEDMHALFLYLELKMKQAGEAILNGKLELAPVKGESFIPSLKEMRSVSLFDATLPENQYRKIEKQEAILALIKQKVGK